MKTQLLFLFFWVVFSLPIQAQLGGEVTGDSARMASMAGAGLAGGVDLLEASRNPAMLGFIIPGNGVDFLFHIHRLHPIRSTDNILLSHQHPKDGFGFKFHIGINEE